MRWQPQGKTPGKTQERRQANGRQNRCAASVSFHSSQRSLFEHHLFGKWDPTLPDRARADLGKWYRRQKRCVNRRLARMQKEKIRTAKFSPNEMFRVRRQCEQACWSGAS